jgi:hypothetical protein
MVNNFGGFNIAAREATICGSGTNTFSVSTREMVGDAVARTLLYPEKRENTYIYISTLETFQNDILASLKRITGAEDWKVKHVSPEEKIQEGKALIEKGQWLWGNEVLALTAAYTGGYGGDFAKEGKLANELLGLGKGDWLRCLRKFLEQQLSLNS